MTLVIIVFGIYYGLLLLLLIGWHKATQHDFPNHRQHFRISVIVPFRNEEKNITAVIRNLITQTYNHEYFEVLLCNDHSTDTSVERVINAIAGLQNFKLVHATGMGKKQALAMAIENATGDIVATTDADCTVPENWLARINHAFQDPELKMVFGGVALREEKSFFSELQAMEFSSLVGSAAATAGLGFPILCNGANLAFLKSAYHEVHGYDGNQNIPSGDDEFLLRKIIFQYPKGICFLNTEDSVVSTRPQQSLNDFIGQRIRWAGKWRYNASPLAVGVAIFVLLFQVFFLGLLIATALDISEASSELWLIGGKIALEFIFLFQFGAFLRLRWRTLHFFALQFLYPVYVIFIGVASNFVPYEWKGRKWNHKSHLTPGPSP
jgi:poly-beta-1,6-N-acetyl-D-glucosamine synthase